MGLPEPDREGVAGGSAGAGAGEPLRAVGACGASEVSGGLAGATVEGAEGGPEGGAAGD